MAQRNTLQRAAEPSPRLRVGRYRLRFRGAAGDTHPLAGRHLGSAWRGAFGHALRRSVCVMGLPPSCDGCAWLASCVYPRTFENRPPADATKLRLYPTAPNPYVLEPVAPRPGCAAVDLGLTLFGRANDDLATVLHALDNAGRHGLTDARVPLRLEAVQAERHGPDGATWAPIEPTGRCRAGPEAALPPAPSAPDAVRVRFLSPLRLRGGGEIVRPNRFDFRAFAANLLRRISLLTYCCGEVPLELDFAALLSDAQDIAMADVQLAWQSLSRRSSRQGAVIPMGGLRGAFTLPTAGLAALWPCLWLGQWTHIGKACTMGLGRYALEPLKAHSAGRWPGPASP